MRERPRILVANDDGINATGIKTLERIARQLSDDVWVVAPETNQSGTGHSLTLNRPLRIRRLGGALASVPTLKEQGVDAVLANWQGVFGPPKLTPAQIAYWDSVFARLVKTDEWRRDQEQNLWESEYLNAAEYARFLKTDFDQARTIFTELGLARKEP